ncbi:MAG: hypothetical protein KBD50_03760 [Candidatus Pacebacteria bacterium]|nr:hypothetical protein [Candidatus Paceibacterota bacterium]
MKSISTVIGIIVVLGLVAAGIYFYKFTPPAPANSNQAETPAEETGEQATTTEREATTVIGKSVEGRDITAYHYGQGDTEILFIGGIHGGYSWNTSLVAYELMDYLEKNPADIPATVTVTVIPALNPDGLYKVVGKEGRFVAADVPASQTAVVAGRFNAHTVDLNRNFDCVWKASGTWQNTKVSGGSAAFSEPESAAIKTYVETHKPRAAVAWYSAAGGVFASSCNNGVSDETLNITNDYAAASGYKAFKEFDFYAITGDMVNWFAKEGIPAVSVLLTNHKDTEWTKNLAGVKAIFKHFSE